VSASDAEAVPRISWNREGLVPVVAQDRLTGKVLMVAWMDQDALAATLVTGKATFHSRSRGKQWVKGETSGNFLFVSSVHVDCDGDTLLLLVDPKGPACHTGASSCFFLEATKAQAEEDGPRITASPTAGPLLLQLEREIASRKSSEAGKSYTKSLLDGGSARIGEKLREEAGELARAIDGESDARVAAEAADVVYHLMVGLASRGVAMKDVLAELARRRGTSGHEEKRSRGG
jgi:phosphoribosyl-ATP pyrophosphohydrolase/phosphoribosyl-AMP cyclohydrolase